MKSILLAAVLAVSLIGAASVAHAQAGVTAASETASQALGVGGGARLTINGGSGTSDGAEIVSHALGASGDVIPGSLASASRCAKLEASGTKVAFVGHTHSGTSDDVGCYLVRTGRFLLNVGLNLASSGIAVHLANGHTLDAATFVVSGVQSICTPKMIRDAGLQMCRKVGIEPVNERAAKPRGARAKLPTANTSSVPVGYNWNRRTATAPTAAPAKPKMVLAKVRIPTSAATGKRAYCAFSSLEWGAYPECYKEKMVPAASLKDRARFLAAGQSFS